MAKNFETFEYAKYGKICKNVEYGDNVEHCEHN